MLLILLLLQVLPNVHATWEPGLHLQVGGPHAEEQLGAAGQSGELREQSNQVYQG